MSEGMSQRIPTRSGGWLWVMTITCTAMRKELGEGSFTRLVATPYEARGKHVYVTLDPANIRVEKVGDHSGWE